MYSKYTQIAGRLLEVAGRLMPCYNRAGRLLAVRWTFAGSCKHPITGDIPRN